MNHIRHINLFSIPAGFSVTLIGAGGIGATSALTLAKMGVQTLVVYDDDVVSEENLATQLHAIDSIGELKTVALAKVLHQFSDELTYINHPMRVDNLTILRSSLVISAVDSISARQDIWQALNSDESRWDYFIDARMAAEEFQMFVLRHDDPEALARYEAHLMGMDESSAPELACTEKATFFCAMAASGAIGAEVRNIVRGETSSHRPVYYIPQFVMHDFKL